MYISITPWYFVFETNKEMIVGIIELTKALRSAIIS